MHDTHSYFSLSLIQMMRVLTPWPIFRGSCRLIASGLTKHLKTLKADAVALSADGGGLICDLIKANSKRRGRVSAG
jgi:hypothetical protein